MTRKEALEGWETKVGNSEVTHQAIWPIAKSLMKRDVPKAPTAIHGHLDLKYKPLDRTNTITDCSERMFTPRDLCHESHERRMETRVQAMLEAVDRTPPERVRP
jgi:hypothetical protein